MEDIEEMVGEQPESLETSTEVEEKNTGSPNGDLAEGDINLEESETERGVPVGKFKSVEDLYQAYNNLHAEFTRKCQKLAEMEKDKTSQEEVSSTDGLMKFLSKNQEAVVYAEEIKARVDTNESLKGDQSAFEKVWAEMLYEKLSAPNKAHEPLVQNLILKDNELKNLVIETYMKQLQENRSPVVMSSGSGERVTKVVTPKPDSFEQAKQVVFDLLK